MTTDFIGRGWAFPVELRHTGAVATVDGVANLEKAMRIILLTYEGERPMRPLFGSRLQDFLFDGISTELMAAMAREVRRALDTCEPRARIDDVEVTADDAALGRVDIAITYTVRATNDEHNLVVPFYLIPGEED